MPLFLLWLLAGSGTYLMACAVKNKSPKRTLVSLLTGKGVPTDVWYPLPGVVTMKYKEFGTQPGGAVGGIGGASGVAGAGSWFGNAVSGVVQGAGSKQAVVDFAKAQLGEPYRFGAAGPNRWDCSGLTMEAYKQIGVNLPHHASSQQLLGHAVPETQAQPGDLVFWGPVSGHVAIYLGNGQVIHAPHTGDVVKISPIWGKNTRRFRRYP